MSYLQLSSGNSASSHRTLTYISETTFISIYVDGTIFAPPSAFRQKVKVELKSEFDCKDLGDARYILGLEVNYTDQGIELSQCGYIEKILLKYGMIDCHPVRIHHLGRQNQVQRSTI